LRFISMIGNIIVFQ